MHPSDITIDLTINNVKVHDGLAKSVDHYTVDTGVDSMTGGRIKRIQPQIGNEPFMLTYGDGVSNVDIKKNG